VWSTPEYVIWLVTETNTANVASKASDENLATVTSV
jgi:hypothetical protein